ncbi:conserved hypothetical protein [Microcystis sp. T1-4]|nr:hypothetical protein [Microcystis sp. T1-4]CCI31623.1 conserved hypothetical protein [Microcystis sp. T1-4]
MSELPPIAGRQVVKALGKIGYELDRQRGSHKSPIQKYTIKQCKRYMSQSATAINTKLIDSLAQIILSLTDEEQQLLLQKIQHPALSDVNCHQGFPFDVQIPNTETLAAIEEVEKHPERLKRYTSVGQMFEDWNSD